jgi:K+-sensing histidine kinase KdpD
MNNLDCLVGRHSKLTTETHAASENDRKEIEIKNILVPIDGSEYSLHAAQYATRIARNEKAELFCIHVVTPHIPYGYATPGLIGNTHVFLCVPNR